MLMMFIATLGFLRRENVRVTVIVAKMANRRKLGLFGIHELMSTRSAVDIRKK